MMFFKKKKSELPYINKLPAYMLLKVDGELVEVSVSPRKTTALINYKHVVVDYYDLKDIMDQVEIVRQALTIENADELSGAFSTSTEKSYLSLDYHSLTMMGDELDKKYEECKRHLLRP
jgi:hypothetical protein